MLEYASSETGTRKPRFIVARVIATIVLAGLLGINSIGNTWAIAYYTPPQMTRAQFEAAAQFGPWEQDPHGEVRAFTLATRTATITGHETREMADSGRTPFGRVRLKPAAFGSLLAFAILIPVTLIWGIPAIIGWGIARLRHRD